MQWLRMLNGETPGKMFPLNKAATLVGRDAACDIALSDNRVSKRHAQIVHTHTAFEINDLQSTNGTHVAGRSVVSSVRLADGDLIELGDTQFLFIESSTAIKTSVRIGSVFPRGGRNRGSSYGWDHRCRQDRGDKIRWCTSRRVRR
jgi:pSer/pThr/pTyr-binding forkhead associated (FHA) protein